LIETLKVSVYTERDRHRGLRRWSK